MQDVHWNERLVAVTGGVLTPPSPPKKNIDIQQRIIEAYMYFYFWKTTFAYTKDIHVQVEKPGNISYVFKTDCYQ